MADRRPSLSFAPQEVDVQRVGHKTRIPLCVIHLCNDMQRKREVKKKKEKRKTKKPWQWCEDCPLPPNCLIKPSESWAAREQRLSRRAHLLPLCFARKPSSCLVQRNAVTRHPQDESLCICSHTFIKKFNIFFSRQHIRTQRDLRCEFKKIVMAINKMLRGAKIQLV